MTYIVNVDPNALDAPMETLCESVSKAFRNLHKPPSKSERPAPLGKSKSRKFTSS